MLNVNNWFVTNFSMNQRHYRIKFGHEAEVALSKAYSPIFLKIVCRSFTET
jgi:hypothetical protein